MLTSASPPPTSSWPSVLPVEASKKVHQKVRTTTVYVTHDQVEAMTLADRVVVMNNGRIEQIGTPNDLYHKPAKQPNMTR
jgi:ABC-type sugar transport system ATPase subunit